MSEARDWKAAEVRWYRAHGKYGEKRIRRDSHGNEYVIGDWSWNGVKGRPTEYIEDRMSSALRREFVEREWPVKP